MDERNQFNKSISISLFISKPSPFIVYSATRVKNNALKMSLRIQLIVLFAFVLLVGKSFSKPTAKNGVAIANQFPYHVSLREAERLGTGLHSFRHFCSGAIVNNRWIITVAHCTHKDRVKKSNLFLVVGANRNTDSGVFHQTYKIINHPFYQIDTADSLKYDISLVKTERKIRFNQQVRPISLGESKIEGDITSVVTGWGRVSN